MKYLISILFLFLISCESKKKQTFVFLDEGIESSTLEIEILNEHNYALAEMYYLENPQKSKQDKDIIDKIKEKSESVLTAIEQKYADIKAKRRLALDTLKNKTAIVKSEVGSTKIDLFISIKEFKNLLDSIFLQDTIIHAVNKHEDKISPLYNYRQQLNWSESRLIVINTFELSLLKNKIQNISNQSIRYFIGKMGKPTIRSNKMEVAVIPINKFIYSNEIYEANLYLVSLDTHAEINCMVDNKTLETKEGKAFYTDTNTNQAGVVNKSGLLKLSDPSTDFSYVYPFTIHYQIKDK